MNSFLPVGSVITIQNDQNKHQKYVILGYFPTTNEEKPKVFDYLCYMYPDGVKNKKSFFVNEEDIDDILFIGYQSKYNDKLLTFFKEQSSVLKNAEDIKIASMEMIFKFNERYGKKVNE